MTLQDLLAIFQRRRMIVYGTLVGVLLLIGLYCVICTRRYEATGSIQVQKGSNDSLGLDTLMNDASSASDALSSNIDLQTQSNILQSDTLALKTIETLHMEQTYDFKQRWSPLGWVMDLITPAGAKDPANATLENAPERRRRALKVFSKNLTVKPISGTRLINISYSNPDPKLAAAVVNTLTQALIDYTYQTRIDATNQASSWLSGQMDGLRQESENLQAKVVALQKDAGFYSLGTTDAQGREQAYSDVLNDLQQSAQALNSATQNRILKGAIAQAAKNGDAEMLSNLAGNNTQSSYNSLSLIQNLRQQEATLQGNLQEMKTKFGPSYPKIAEVQGNITGIERSIHSEIERVRGRAESDYAIAQHSESNIRKQYEDARGKADQLNDKAVQYAIVRQEAEESRALYEDLLKRLKESGVLEGLKPSNITVVDPGRTPSKPVKPNVPLYMAIALGGGLFLGGCGALLTDTLDNKINSINDLEELTGKTVIGALPSITAKDIPNGHINITELTANSIYSYAEALYSIRTALLHWRSKTPPKVILVTSSLAGEGKTTISANLAIALAQQKKKVLVIDTDMRRGLLRKRFGILSDQGLSEALSGQWIEKEIPTAKDLPNLHVLQAGVMPPNPSELLGSDAMQYFLERWRDVYDFIVLDAPPVLPVTDAVLLSPLADATLMVVRSGLTQKLQVRRSRNLLAEENNRPIGMILNGVKPSHSDYYGYYGYTGKSGYYGRKEHKDNA